MNVQLLLLLALVSPFCGFTHASPTVVPTDSDAGITETAADVTPDGTDAPKEYLTVVTGAPATVPEAAPEEVVTDAVTEAVPATPPPNTEEPIVETAAPVDATTAAAAAEPLNTDPPAVETAAPTEAALTEAQPVVTAAAEEQPGGDVVIEAGLSSGQVVGIVIGALLAVVIVIAVVIAVVRRMGKYSSAKNKKPAKKDSIMVSPLRKKPAQQQEHPKFWKF